MAHALGGFDFISPLIGFVSTGLGNLLLTTDGGRSFHQVPGTPAASVLATSWPDPQIGYVSALGVLMHTADEGSHRRHVYPALTPRGPISLTTLRAGVGVGMSWFPAILWTGNGTDWRQVGELPATSIDGLVRTSSETVWAVASLLLSSTESPHAWVIFPLGRPCIGRRTEGSPGGSSQHMAARRQQGSAAIYSNLMLVRVMRSSVDRSPAA